MAFIHTQGVVSGRTYVPLELSYWDYTGYRHTLLVQSPLSFTDATRLYPRARPEVYMSTREGVRLETVLRFLRRRYDLLGLRFFYCKGNSYQPDILRWAGIPHENIERSMRVPPIRTLERMFRTSKSSTVPITCIGARTNAPITSSDC